MKRIALLFVCLIGPLGCDGNVLEDGTPAPDDIQSIRAAAFGSGGTDVGNYYQLKSVSSGLCADVNGKFTDDGTAIIQFGCSTGDNQRFYFRALSTTDYQLSAKHSAKCLHISGGSTASGALLVQDSCARSGTAQNGQVFTATRVGTGTPAQYQLVVKNGGKCLQSPNTTSKSQLVQNTCGTSDSFLWNLQVAATLPQSDTNGHWSPVIGLPAVPISAAMLPNKRVITWASWKALRFAGTGSLDQTVTVNFPYTDPSTNSTKTVTNTTHNMFCPGTSMLADGRVLVNGGDDSHTDATSIYDYKTDSWTRGAAMHEQRWYNVTVTLPDGRALTLGGNRTSGQSGDGEIYDPIKNSWTMMSGIALAALTAGAADINRAMEHPRMFVALDGRVFVPGPTPNMQFYSTGGSGSVTSAGRRSNDEFSQNDVTVMFDVGKLLKAGGNINYDRTNASFTPSSQNSYIINISNNSASVTPIGPMHWPRAFANGVVLPNGQVVVVGGADNGKGFSDDGNIRVPELFDPVTNSWRDLAPMAKPRPYHSIALLLPDGKVLVGGGGLCSSSDNCSVNHPDVEILSPPNLFGATRPSITSAPATVTTGSGTFDVTVSGTVTGFSLIRMSSVTHTVNTDQRFMRLASSGTTATRTLTAPANKNIAPPGYYMLFALNGDVPSVAAIVKLN
jgi:galactose oxidase